VQLIAGMVLARGQLAEMQTGEGKTIAAALPAFVHALKGQGVHIITANSYLAARDCTMLSPAFELLGVTARLLPERGEPAQKQAAYRADITFGTGYEFGFDYLRDQVKLRQRAEAPLGQAVLDRLYGVDEEAGFLQRGLAFAIIDEIDSVLLDDAVSPLVLSDPSARFAPDALANRLARETVLTLEKDRDYRLRLIGEDLELTPLGLERIHARLSAVPLHVLQRPWAEYVRQAILAECCYRRDVHYVVRQGRVRIVDESTGRIFEDRHWRDGLHQAIEAKEGLEITAEQVPVAQITRQRYFRLYPKLCGMTGTATGSEAEFSAFYHLNVVSIPLRTPCRRQVLPARYFADAQAKWRAVAQAACEHQKTGRPVLIGTRSIAESEALSVCLNAAGLAHQLLNGCQDEEEARIIERAGEPGTVTIATNMAGRGTDIKLSRDALSQGGLHIIGTERHDSRRIDRQLFGRSARQGDPGSAQFFLSAADHLIAECEPRLARLMKRSADAQGEVHIPVTPLVDRAQNRREQSLFRSRRELFRADQDRETLLHRLHVSD
jgi:preprotein translocase subunit SecA